jgi:hypothetical protein
LEFYYLNQAISPARFARISTSLLIAVSGACLGCVGCEPIAWRPFVITITLILLVAYQAYFILWQNKFSQRYRLRPSRLI